MTEQRAPRPIVDEITPWMSALAAVSRVGLAGAVGEGKRSVRISVVNEYSFRSASASAIFDQSSKSAP